MFTYFQLINVCSSVDILMLEILKVVESAKIYENKGSRGSLGAGHFDTRVCLGGWHMTNVEDLFPGGRDANAWN